jgi:hypothetical protein
MRVVFPPSLVRGGRVRKILPCLTVFLLALSRIAAPAAAGSR